MKLRFNLFNPVGLCRTVTSKDSTECTVKYPGHLPIHRYTRFRALTDEWIEEYNERRPHEALQNRTPSEWKQQIQP